MINSSKIIPPQLTLTQSAIDQYQLITQSDFTLEQQVFRVQITGKGCQGFDYSIGFSASQEEDIVVKDQSLLVEIHIDPFSAFYLEKALIDFQFDPQTEEEGFIVKVEQEDKFYGKFWRRNDQLIPPQKEVDSHD